MTRVPETVGAAQPAGELPLILLPGMGANERLFRLQRPAFRQLLVPAWLTPRPGESLPSYAERMARAIDPGRPCLVGGASFGGFVAVEMVRHLQARALILVGSARSPAEFGPGLRSLRHLAPLARLAPFDVGRAAAGLVGRHGGPLLTPTLRRVLRQLGDADGRFLRWASEATLRWRRDGTVSVGVPVFQIHGGRDPVLPASRSWAEEVIPGGGHVISLSHARQVNAFLRRCLTALAPESPSLGPTACGAYDARPKEDPTQWPSIPPAS